MDPPGAGSAQAGRAEPPKGLLLQHLPGSGAGGEWRVEVARVATSAAECTWEKSLELEKGCFTGTLGVSEFCTSTSPLNNSLGTSLEPQREADACARL